MINSEITSLCPLLITTLTWWNCMIEVWTWLNLKKTHHCIRCVELGWKTNQKILSVLSSMFDQQPFCFIINWVFRRRASSPNEQPSTWDESAVDVKRLPPPSKSFQTRIPSPLPEQLEQSKDNINLNYVYHFAFLRVKLKSANFFFVVFRKKIHLQIKTI